MLTKTDLPDAQPAALSRRLSVLNPLAPVLVGVHGAVDPARLLGGDVFHLAARSSQARDWLAGAGAPHDHGHHHAHDPNRHDAAISCFAIVREKPIPAVVLTLLLEILAEHCGADLLRMKGILAIAESPERPAAVHGVQHVFHAPVWLDAWPSADRRSRLVFIVRNIPQAWIEAVIAAIEAEVAEVAAAAPEQHA